MKGKVLDFSAHEGIISGDDGKRYKFSDSQWKSPKPPSKNACVDFDTDGEQAVGIYLDSTSAPSGSNAKQVPNYLVQAILVTLFCCLPFGIVSIVYAAQVNDKLASGDYEGALHSSKNAKMWAWIAFGIVLVGIVLLMVLGVLGAMIPSYQIR